MKKLLPFLAGVLVLSACSSVPALKAGDAVLVDWAQDDYAWHNSKLVAECEGGWTVSFTDGFYNEEEGAEAKCYPEKDIVADKVPDDGDVKVGDKIYAEWGGSFYSATVDAIKDGKYSLKYDDDYEDEVELADIRLRPKTKNE